MNLNLWTRTGTALRARYERTALAQYGSELHAGCDDCAVELSDVAIPVPRTAPADSARLAAERP